MARRGRKKFDYMAVAENSKALGEAYNLYAFNYEVRQKKLRKRGFEMTETKYSKAEFKSFYIGQGNDLINQNKTASTSTIIKGLIDRQSHKWSRKQARAFKKILREQGIEAPTELDIMYGAELEEEFIWDEVRKAKAQFKKENYHKMSTKQYWQEEAHYIGMTFFGSK